MTRRMVYDTTSRARVAVRHLSVLAPHLTPRRLLNVMRNEAEYRLRKSALASLPFYIKVELTPLCHLACRGCTFHGPEAVEKYPRNAVLDLDGFRQIVLPVADTLLGVSFHLRGEPLLDPHIWDILHYCREMGIGTSFHTSFSVPLTDDQIGEMVAARLEKMVVAVDGATQEVYEQYRVGGRLATVLDNMARLQEAKRRAGSRLPRVEVQSVLFEHNRHQMDDIHRLADRFGADCASMVATWDSCGAKGGAAGTTAVKRGRPRGCFWLWQCAVVCWDGAVLPCPVVAPWPGRGVVGNALETPLPVLWNSPRYQAMRTAVREADRTQSRRCAACLGTHPASDSALVTQSDEAEEQADAA